jgi:phosphoribosylformylglycinamidine synthase
VEDVRVGKVIYLDLVAGSATAAVEAAEAMCRKLLANPVTEDFEVSVVGELQEAGS